MEKTQTNAKLIKRLQAQIIVLSLIRDSVRQIAPLIFKRSENEDPKTTFSRRDMVYEAILEALEDLEDKLEEQQDLAESEESEKEE